MNDVKNDPLNLSEEEKKKIPSQIPARKKIIEILGKIETRQAFTDKVLENELKDFSGADKSLITEVVYGVMRWMYRLDWFLQHLYVHYSHPRWLVQRWIEYWGIDEVTQMLKKNNQRPRLYIRVNHLKATQRQVVDALEEHQVPYEIHSDFPEFIWIKDFARFRELNLLKEGWVSVQDVSTGLPVKLLQPQPGEMVLDMCAAPGGKAGYIGEVMHNRGFLLCVDRHVHRSRMLKDNLRRWGVEHACVVNADATQLPVRQNIAGCALFWAGGAGQTGGLEMEAN